MDVKLYKVGGFVRDQILGIPSKDIDYAVEANSYEIMKQYILDKGGKIYLESPGYLTIRAKLNNEDADFVLCRKDGSYHNGRHPDSVEIGDIYDDLVRRDFTMNAIAIKEDGNYLDPYNGIQDIKDQVIRCVGSIDRLKEDGLRLIRALRFSITKGFKLDNEIREFIQAETSIALSVMTNVSSERIMEELNKMFTKDTRLTLQIIQNYNLFFFGLFSMKDDLKFKTYVGK